MYHMTMCHWLSKVPTLPIWSGGSRFLGKSPYLYLYLNLPILRMKRKNVTFSKRILVKFPCNFSKMKKTGCRFDIKNGSQFAYGKNGCWIDKKAVFRQEGCFVRQSFVIICMKGGNLQLLYSRVSESRNGASERKFKFSKFSTQSH
jgi:hypothetical protein